MKGKGGKGGKGRPVGADPRAGSGKGVGGAAQQGKGKGKGEWEEPQYIPQRMSDNLTTEQMILRNMLPATRCHKSIKHWVTPQMLCVRFAQKIGHKKQKDTRVICLTPTTLFLCHPVGEVRRYVKMAQVESAIQGGAGWPQLLIKCAAPEHDILLNFTNDSRNIDDREGPETVLEKLEQIKVLRGEYFPTDYMGGDLIEMANLHKDPAYVAPKKRLDQCKNDQAEELQMEPEYDPDGADPVDYLGACAGEMGGDEPVPVPCALGSPVGLGSPTQQMHRGAIARSINAEQMHRGAVRDHQPQQQPPSPPPDRYPPPPNAAGPGSPHALQPYSGAPAPPPQQQPPPPQQYPPPQQQYASPQQPPPPQQQYLPPQQPPPPQQQQYPPQQYPQPTSAYHSPQPPPPAPAPPPQHPYGPPGQQQSNYAPQREWSSAPQQGPPASQQQGSKGGKGGKSRAGAPAGGTVLSQRGQYDEADMQAIEEEQQRRKMFSMQREARDAALWDQRRDIARNAGSPRPEDLGSIAAMRSPRAVEADHAGHDLGYGPDDNVPEGGMKVQYDGGPSTGFDGY